MTSILTKAALISLLTLTQLEVVLGIENIIFVTIVAGKFPIFQRKRAQNYILRIALFPESHYFLQFPGLLD
ncbi:hypothetical protein ACFP1I_24575 [Dyadobacter subterraneus]|uniref:hypothetical protein n=1 Tax=Dyadobacter subterraneus TaxID=2773304 RepID=UPI001D1694C2|nr:hypothetical protein [Dyadobacter subterraneus]